MSEERLRILKMVEEGKISAEEAEQLMRAIDETEEQTGQDESGAAAAPSADSAASARVLKIRVYKTDTDEPKVNLNIPLRFIGFIKSMIPRSEKAKIEQRGFDLDELVSQAESGSIGTIMDVEDEEDGERVLITLE